MQIEAKDDDQAGTINAEIVYSIVSQEPAGRGDMFTIDRKTGKLYVKEPTLDRETHDFYKLVIKGTDMGGAPGGKTGTGTVEIQVLDINDNIPTLEKSEVKTIVETKPNKIKSNKIKCNNTLCFRVKKNLNTNNLSIVSTVYMGNREQCSTKTGQKTCLSLS
ncbi:hypothetical protein AMECASPLE_033938 [Ameca splendens]|uniref:Cadherin domain-containing protein n=1 Tax=Ameca splendens TaxID=208324 RepID=A0ABV1A5G8_9TELE